jgi:hypothetical protein
MFLREGPTIHRPFSPLYPRTADKRSHLSKSPRHPAKAVDICRETTPRDPYAHGPCQQQVVLQHVCCDGFTAIRLVAVGERRSNFSDRAYLG